jgi:putative nucleotidyltransferase with HDIG domain
MDRRMTGMTAMTSQQQKDDVIQYLVEQVNASDISSIKSTVNAIIRVINDPRSTVKELKEVILLDPPLAAKVLRIANSAYYSRSFTRTITEIEKAIIWIGSDIIKELALSQKVCEIFDRDEEIGAYSRKSLWIHSIAVALTAKMTYRKEFGLPGENAYMAGLLHDIGIIAEDQFLQEDFQKVLLLSQTKNMDMARAETETWGYTHAELGQAIGDSWNLPAELVATIGFHPRPLAYQGSFSKIICTLYAADYICQEKGFAFGAAPIQDKPILQKCLKKIAVKPHALDLIFKSMKAEMSKMHDKGLF